MSKQRSLRMDDRFDRFIEDRIGSEDYETAEDVVQAGLLLLEQEEEDFDRLCQAFDHEQGRPMSLEEVRQAIREGEESGEAGELDVEALFRDIVAEASASR